MCSSGKSCLIKVEYGWKWLTPYGKYFILRFRQNVNIRGVFWLRNNEYLYIIAEINSGIQKKIIVNSLNSGHYSLFYTLQPTVNTLKLNTF